MNIEDIVYQNFRRNLQILRVANGFTAEELAEKIKCNSKKRVTDMEYGERGRGVPKIDEVVALAKVFGVTTDDLLVKKATINFE